MKVLRIQFLIGTLLVLAIGAFFNQTLVADDMKLTSAGPIAFGPDGLLLISDPMDAKIYAVETEDTDGTIEGVAIEVEDIKGKIAAMMGVKPNSLRINDLAVNPINGHAYLSVTRGSGQGEQSAIMVVDPKTNSISEFDVKDKQFSSTTLTNAAESKQSRRGGDQRLQAITDLAFIDNKVYVAGLSNEEFASNLRSIDYPFSDVDDGTSIEIYHGAHGKFETRSPIRTFAALTVDNEVNLLAAYTCTPLVRIPISELKPKTKVKGTTIAELGNHNRPLDMVVYAKDSKDYALMANSSRGVMKIDLSDAGTQTGIKKRIKGTAGIPFETIEDLEGVMQLDGLSETHGVVLVLAKDGKEHLRTILLP